MKSPRFKVDPLSDSFVRLVDIIFGLTLTQGLVLHRNIITNPTLSSSTLTLLLAYATIILSWIGYHKSVFHYPYNKSDWSKIRLFFDILVLVLYAYIVFVVPDLQRVIFAIGIVFVIYLVDGFIRIGEWHDKKVSQPLLTLFTAISFYILWGMLVILGDYWWLFAPLALVNLIVYRIIRSKKYSSFIVVGVDVDGVLGDQVPPTLARIQKNGKGIGLTKSDITDWNFPIEDTTTTKEIEQYLLDKEFIREMPVINGSTSALDKMYKDFHVVIATNRPVETEQHTIDWVKKHFKFHEFINTRDVGKDSLGLDVLIDDNIDNVKGCAKVAKKTVLFLQPWNQNFSDTDFDQLVKEKKIARCESWKEVLDALYAFKNQQEKRA